MKRLKLFAVLACSAILLTSCGVNHAYMFNANQNVTQVNLSQANYTVVGKAAGSADVSYVLIFGGRKESRLFANAYADMVSKADLSSGAKALTNIVTEEHVGGVPPFYYTRTVTVSATVIEFNK